MTRSDRLFGTRMAAITGDGFPLQSLRLFLRPVAPSDAGALHGLYSDWEVAKWLSRLPWPFSQTSAMSLVADARHDLRHGSGCVLAMFERTTSVFVGVVSLRIPALEAEPWTTDTGLGDSRLLGDALALGQRLCHRGCSMRNRICFRIGGSCTPPRNGLTFESRLASRSGTTRLHYHGVRREGNTSVWRTASPWGCLRA
jgi:Acetyltransferase (GNAT) domain